LAPDRKRRGKTLIFDRERFRYQSFLSDIAGQDVHPHGGEVQQLIRELAIWLRDQARDPKVAGGAAIASEFSRFKVDLPAISANQRLEVSELTFKDLAEIAAQWIVHESGAKAASKG